ncbi:hypothetical protein DFH08DRAFT_699754 [Mycena albidolilacea]|uniref:Uncharacterized protein n=1 Tax=Mycena albidolilacea TaxID=1033008 RepID=A0AAD7EQQ5_9AGAR|nr:hypothetical protein DFH08DRAFT_699754 [Mycena albidolilacea]
MLKVIRKTEVKTLCMQHNPVIVTEHRTSKAEGLHTDILTLAPLSCNKVCVSASVFEVTLMHVYEEHRSVEVLWEPGG